MKCSIRTYMTRLALSVLAVTFGTMLSVSSASAQGSSRLTSPVLVGPPTLDYWGVVATARWNQIWGNNGYQVRWRVNNGSWVTRNVGRYVTSAQHRVPRNGNTVCVQVRALGSSSDTHSYWSFMRCAYLKRVLSTPILRKPTVNSAGTIATTSWNQVLGNIGYQVQWRVNDGSWITRQVGRNVIWASYGVPQNAKVCVRGRTLGWGRNATSPWSVQRCATFVKENNSSLRWDAATTCAADRSTQIAAKVTNLTGATANYVVEMRDPITSALIHGSHVYRIAANSTGMVALGGLPERTGKFIVLENGVAIPNVKTLSVRRMPCSSGKVFVRSFIVVPRDRVGEYNTVGVNGTLGQILPREFEDVRRQYYIEVGDTYETQTHVIFSNKNSEWFWCRTQDVSSADLGCAADNWEHNLMQELAARGYRNDNDEVYNIVVLGGGGWAGGRANRAMMGEAGWVAYRDGNCARVRDAFPGDGTSGLCAAGNWGSTATGTVAHEIGHAFGLPGHGAVDGCVNVSWMDYQGCYSIDPHLDADEVQHLRNYFAR